MMRSSRTSRPRPPRSRTDNDARPEPPDIRSWRRSSVERIPALVVPPSCLILAGAAWPQSSRPPTALIRFTTGLLGTMTRISAGFLALASVTRLSCEHSARRRGHLPERRRQPRAGTRPAIRSRRQATLGPNGFEPLGPRSSRRSVPHIARAGLGRIRSAGPGTFACAFEGTWARRRPRHLSR
jgi:hypothetical protein